MNLKEFLSSYVSPKYKTTGRRVMAIVMCGAGMMLKAMGGNELTIRRNSDGRMEVFMDGDKLGNGYPVKNEAWLDEKTVCAGHA